MELSQLIQQQTARLEELTQEVRYLHTLVMRDKLDTTWLTEDDAAAMLQMKPDTLRRYVKDRRPLFEGIGFRHTNGRKYQYNRKDLLKFKNLTSNYGKA